MKLTWSPACGGGSVRVRFQGDKKLPSKGEELNTLVINAVKEILKYNKCVKAKDEHDSGSEEEQENFNFEDLNIGKY